MLRLYCLPPVAFVDLVEREEEEEERTPISMTPIERWLEMTVPFLDLFSGSVSDAFRVMRCCLKKCFLTRNNILYAWSLCLQNSYISCFDCIVLCNIFLSVLLWEFATSLRLYCGKHVLLIEKNTLCLHEITEEWVSQQTQQSTRKQLNLQVKTSSFETEGFLSLSFVESGRTFFYICRFLFVNLQKVFLRSWSLEGHSPCADFLCKLAFWQALVLRHHGQEFQDHHR